jgi:hypothetical protein
MDVNGLTISADELAEKAEKSHSVTCMAKSSGLRRSAKDKLTEITVLDVHI